jgi:uncharacterized FlaG/YvyC family protein
MSQSIANVTAITSLDTGLGNRGSVFSGIPNSQSEATAAAQPSLQQTVAALNDYYSDKQPDLKFRLDQDKGDLVISVINVKDGSVLSQIPNEDVRRIAAELSRSTSNLISTNA